MLAIKSFSSAKQAAASEANYNSRLTSNGLFYYGAFDSVYTFIAYIYGI